MMLGKSISARLGAVMAVALLMCYGAPASATLMLTLQRVNDSTAILEGTGTTVVAGDVLTLVNVLSTLGNTGTNNVHTGNFAVGGIALATNGVFGDNGDPTVSLIFAALFANGSSPSGASTLTLDVEVWAPIGTTRYHNRYWWRNNRHL